MTWWPGWNSAETAGWWSGFYFWFGIGCLFLLGVSEVISHRYGLRKDELVATAERARTIEQEQKDAQHATEVSEARAKIAELEHRQQPRHLTDEQKASLARLLKDKPSGFLSIFVQTTATDGDAYAAEIAGIFEGAGWRTQTDHGIMFGGGDLTGIWLRIAAQDTGHPPAELAVAWEAIKNAGIELRDGVSADGSVEAGIVQLVIGPRF